MSRILLVRTDGIGDVLLSVPLAQALKEEGACEEVWLLTRNYTREAGENHPNIDGVLTTDNAQGTPYEFGELMKRIKSKSFDAAILLYPRFTFALMLALAGIPIRAGTGYRWFSFLFTHRIYEHRKKNEKHELEYNLSLLRALGITAERAPLSFSVPELADRAIDRMLREMHIDDSLPIVVIHPGSGGSALEWPLEHYAGLAERLEKPGVLRIVVTGGPKEEVLLARFKEICRAPLTYIYPGLTLSELGALLKRASLVLTNSTGPLHLAVAVGTEVIGMYPPIMQCSPKRWGPYGKMNSVIVPQCREFKSRKEMLHTLPDCMRLISVDQVYAMAAEKLNLERCSEDEG